MLKKGLLLSAALLFAVCVHLRPCWRYELDALPAGSRFGLRAAALAEETAQRAAEEILSGSAALPEARRHLRFTLRRPASDARPLTDALLRSTNGVVRRDEVRVDGVRLGWVEDSAALYTALDGYIVNTLPTWASGGTLSRALTTRRLYTREGYLTPAGDMLLLVTGAAPVFYHDEAGYSAWA